MRHTRSFTVKPLLNWIQYNPILRSTPALVNFLQLSTVPPFSRLLVLCSWKLLGQKPPSQLSSWFTPLRRLSSSCHHPWKPSLSTFPSSLFYFVRSPTAPSVHLYHSITHTPLWLSAYSSIFLTCHWAPWGLVLSLRLLYPWLLVATQQVLVEWMTALLTGSTILNFCEPHFNNLWSRNYIAYFTGILWE